MSIAVSVGRDVGILHLSCVTVEEVGIDGNGLVCVFGAVEMGAIELFVLLLTATFVDGAGVVVTKNVDLIAEGEELLNNLGVAMLSEVAKVEIVCGLDFGSENENYILRNY